MRTPIAFILLVFCALHPYTATGSEFQLCFFTLNNEQEFKATQDMVSRIRSQSPELKITVRELFPWGASPSDQFEKIFRKNIKCDGLVLSGHHRSQGFDGKRTSGYLPIVNLERWSCHPKYSEWFQQIKAVWLQGCATSKRTADSTEMLSHQYSKIFPGAMIFAWSGNAPSRSAPKTIPYQIANLSKILSKKGPKVNFKQSLSYLLAGSHAKASTRAWHLLRYSTRSRSFGIYNHSAQAFLPFTTVGSPEEIESLQMSCALKNSSLANVRLSHVDRILTVEKILWDNAELLMKESRFLNENNPEYSREFKERLSQSKEIGEVLEKRINSKSIGILSKIALYRLYIFAGNDRNIGWEFVLRQEAILGFESVPKGFDRVEKKHYLWRIARALLTPFSGGVSLISASSASKLKNSDSILALLKIAIQIHPPITPKLLVAIARNPNSDRRILKELQWMFRAYQPLGHSEVRNLIQSKQVVKQTLATPTKF